jgi:hypothetical protein
VATSPRLLAPSSILQGSQGAELRHEQLRNAAKGHVASHLSFGVSTRSPYHS